MRVLSFPDGFTSATPPILAGGSVQDDYVIINNSSAPVSLFQIDSSQYKSAFFDYEIEREDSNGVFRQAGSFVMLFDGINWGIEYGNYQGSDIINDSIINPQSVVFSISSTLGVGELLYTSGNMVGTSYTGKLKLISTKVIA